MTKMLEHESAWIETEIAAGLAENVEASAAMSEAIEKGNQWHDNPEYDEVIERMRLIDTRYGFIMRAFRDREVMPYPEPNQTTIGLGSLVTIEDDYEAYEGLLIGMPTIGENRYRELRKADSNLASFEIIGSDSPLGLALIDTEAETTVSWAVGDRSMSAEIHGVDNLWLVSRLGALTAADSVEVTE